MQTFTAEIEMILPGSQVSSAHLCHSQNPWQHQESALEHFSDVQNGS